MKAKCHMNKKIIITFCFVFVTLFFSIYKNFKILYNQHIYVFIHSVLYKITHHFPFPFALIYIILFVCIILYIFNKTKEKFLNIIIVFLWQIILFYWLWGFNYGNNLFETTNNKNNSLIDSFYINEAFTNQRKNLNEIKNKIIANKVVEPNEKELQAALIKACIILKLPSKYYVKIRELKPNGILLRNGISGIFIPFSHEGHIDAGLTDIEKPFVKLHEMSHGASITDEGEANFVAYIAAIQSNNLHIQYSAALEYWYLLSKWIKQHNKSLYFQELNLLSKQVSQDIKHIKNNNQKYYSKLSKVGNNLNDIYLKTQGIQSGNNSYDELLYHILDWKIKQKQ